MDKINPEILRQFEGQGLTINEGIAFYKGFWAIRQLS